MRLIGYISLDELGNPLRKPRSGYSFQTQAQSGYHPPRIYTTIAKAKSQSPVDRSTPVYIGEDAE